MLKMHHVGTISTFKMHHIGTVPTFKNLNVGTKNNNKIIVPKSEGGGREVGWWLMGRRGALGLGTTIEKERVEPRGG
jgi:hypothetical protein